MTTLTHQPSGGNLGNQGKDHFREEEEEERKKEEM